MFTIEPDRLLKEELEYEISIRGIKPQGNLKDLIKTLRELLSLESEGHSFKIVYNLISKDELTICGDKLKEIERLLNETVTTSWTRKLKTKLAHVLNRLERIETSTSDEADNKAKLLTQCLEFVSIFKSKQKAPQPSSPDIPADLAFQFSLLNTQGGSSTPNQGTANSNNQTTSNTSQTSQISSAPVDHKLYKNIASWGLSFSGRSDTLSLNAFFERVDEICEARGISKDQLFKCAAELFDGEARVYYRSIKSKVSDWDSLCNLFRDEFFRDGNKKIWEQIKSRTQGHTETIAIYVAYMTNLFNRLSISVDESLKLEIIKERLRPEYQNKLDLVDDIDSLDKLIKIGRRLEDTNRKIANFVPPSLDKNAIEVDLQYKSKVDSSKKKIDNIQTDKQVTFENSTFSKDNSKESRSRSQSRDNSIDRNRSRERTRNNEFRENGRDFSSDRYSNSCDRESRYNSTDRQGNGNSYFRENTNFRRNNSRDRFLNDNRDFERNISRDRNRSNSRDRFRNSTDRVYRDSSSNRAYNSNGSRERSYSNQRYDRGDSFQSNSQNRSVDSQIRCYNCNGLNHMAKHCRFKSNKKCFNCGTLGYTRNTCIKCKQGNSYRNRV